MDVTKPYEFIMFGATYVTKPCELVRFGAMDVTKPYEFIGFGAMDVTKPYEFISFGAPRTRAPSVTDQTLRGLGPGGNERLPMPSVDARCRGDLKGPTW